MNIRGFRITVVGLVTSDFKTFDSELLSQVSSLTNDCYLQTRTFRFIMNLNRSLKLYPKFKNVCFVNLGE